MTTTTSTDRFNHLLQNTSPALLEAAAAALLAVANDLTMGTPGERLSLASIAAELRSLAWERSTGVGK